MSKYENKGPADCTATIDTSLVAGKTAIVTGGALGIGEAYVRALVKAGAHVLIADISEKAGNKLHDAFPDSTTFVNCDVASFQSQVSLFKRALEVSPSSRIDVVVANAGISTTDQVFFNEIDGTEPKEPSLAITDINIKGMLYTTTIALWHFRKQNTTGPRQDQCLVLQGSVTGYVDIYGAPQYTISKFAARGLMRSLRQSELAHGIRVNLIAPWYVRTTIMTDSLIEAVERSGAGFATLEDAGQTLLRIVGDSSIHGRAVATMPRNWPGASQGFVDLDEDDFDSDVDSWMERLQTDIVKPVTWIQSHGQKHGNVY